MTTTLENAISRSAASAASAGSPDTDAYGDQPTTSSVNRVPRSTDSSPTSASMAFSSTSLRDSLIMLPNFCRIDRFTDVLGQSDLRSGPEDFRLGAREPPPRRWRAARSPGSGARPRSAATTLRRRSSGSALARHQPLGLQPVEQTDHRGAVDLEAAGRLLLRLGLSRVEEQQDRQLAAADARRTPGARGAGPRGRAARA